MTGKEIIDKCLTLLSDAESVRWSRAELLDWANEACQRLVIECSDANPVCEVTPLVAGTRQELPPDSLKLVDVIRNMGSDRETPGLPVSFTTRNDLDKLMPHWHTSSPCNVTKHCIYNPHQGKLYYIYPPQPSENVGSLEVILSKLPDKMSEEEVCKLQPKYWSAVLDYVLYRAYSKEADTPMSINKSLMYYNAFQQALSREPLESISATTDEK